MDMKTIKPFRFKKIKDYKTFFIKDGLVTNFKKPKFPLVLILKIHKPGIFELPSNFQIITD